MKTIHVIVPIVETKDFITAKDMEKMVEVYKIPKLIDIKVLFLKSGPSSIEDEVDDALCLPDLMRMAMVAAKSGSSGIFVNCMCDPGVRVLRTMLNIPVVGPAETSFHLAATLCHKFSVVDIGFDTAPMVEDLIHRYGLSQSFASIRGTGIPVEHIEAGPKTYDPLSKAALAAIEKDGADGIVLGCTGFVGCNTYIRKFLLEKGYDVPVIDPMPVTIRTLSSIVMEGLCHSKKAWPNRKPAGKRLDGFSDKDALKKLYPSHSKL